MSRSSQPRRGRGRPRREYRIRVVGERLEQPDYNKLARALLEHAAMQARETAAKKHDETTPPLDDAIDDEEVRS
ncbi:hypothetical protein CH252_21095 [Rhodococcus sp. 06-1477-1B]|nr:hypothetical protein CH252_21095 [Rhodococcus sp. 06-1477-1B]